MSAIQPPTGAEIPKFVRASIVRFDELGFPEALPETRNLLEDYQDRYIDSLKIESVSRDGLARAVTTGKLSAQAASDEIDAARAEKARIQQIKNLQSGAAGRDRTKLWHVFSGECDDAMLLMQARHDEAMEAFSSAVRDIPANINDDRTALRGGGKVAAAWAQALESMETRNNLTNFADKLRGAGALSMPGESKWHRGFSVLEYRWRNPMALPSYNPHNGSWTSHISGNAPARIRNQHPIRQLQEHIARGAGPALLTAGDLMAVVDQERRAVDEERRAEEAARPPKRQRKAALITTTGGL